MSLKEEEELHFGVRETRVKKESYVEFTFIKKKADTGKAILFEYIDAEPGEDGAKRIAWIPASQIQKIETNKDGTGIATIAQWIADRNNLPY